jgi:hypothetical protein
VDLNVKRNRFGQLCYVTFCWCCSTVESCGSRTQFRSADGGGAHWGHTDGCCQMEKKWAAVGNCAIASGPRMDSEEDSVEEIRGRPHSKINFRGVTIAPQIDFIGPRTLYESTVPLAVTGIRGL